MHGAPINLMLSLEVPDEELIKRILLRSKDSGRADDRCESVIRNRIDVYKAQTAIVAEHYKKQGKYRAVNGTGDIDGIFRNLCSRDRPAPEIENGTDPIKRTGYRSGSPFVL